MSERTVGLIGLGLLGGALAQRLIERGFRVVGHDADVQRCDVVAAEGVVMVASAAEVVDACQWVMLCLPNGDVASDVLTSITARLRPGQIVIDTTTAAPEQMIHHAALLSPYRVSLVEAEIAGSSAQARRGEVIVFAAGEESEVVQVKDLLNAFAAEVCYVGRHGNAAKLKLVHNLVLGLHRAVLAEGLSLATALELDAAQVLSLLERTPAASVVMKTKGPKMVARDFAPQATIRQHLKDVRLIAAAGEQAGVELPLTAVHRALLDRVEAAGLGQLDNSAVIEAWAQGHQRTGASIGGR